MIDLKTCKPGDILISCHGKRFVYIEYKPEQKYPHIIQCESEYQEKTNFGWGTRLDDGKVANRSLPTDHDIIEIVKSNKNMARQRYEK
jgi:hypothetical protein